MALPLPISFDPSLYGTGRLIAYSPKTLKLPVIQQIINHNNSVQKEQPDNLNKTLEDTILYNESQIGGGNNDGCMIVSPTQAEVIRAEESLLHQNINPDKLIPLHSLVGGGVKKTSPKKKKKTSQKSKKKPKKNRVKKRSSKKKNPRKQRKTR